MESESLSQKGTKVKEEKFKNKMKFSIEVFITETNLPAASALSSLLAS